MARRLDPLRPRAGLFDSGGERLVPDRADDPRSAPPGRSSTPRRRGRRQRGEAGRLETCQDPKLQKLVEELTGCDKTQTLGSSGAAAVKHHLDRADILEKIVGGGQGRQSAIRGFARWPTASPAPRRRAADGDGTASTRLASLEKQLVKHMPGSNLAAYVAFRAMQAEYAVKLGAGARTSTRSRRTGWRS